MRNLDFDLKPSKHYLIMQLTVMILSILIVIFLPIAWSERFLLLIAATLYPGYIIWRDGLLRSPQSIIQIRWNADGTWMVRTNSKMMEAKLRSDSTSTRWLTLLRFEAPKEAWRASCVVFHDSLPADRYKQLRALLLMG